MTATDEWLRVESLDLDAQGVAHNSEGKGLGASAAAVAGEAGAALLVAVGRVTTARSSTGALC